MDLLRGHRGLFPEGDVRGAGRTDRWVRLRLLALSERDEQVLSASWTGPHDTEGGRAMVECFMLGSRLHGGRTGHWSPGEGGVCEGAGGGRPGDPGPGVSGADITQIS